MFHTILHPILLLPAELRKKILRGKPEDCISYETETPKGMYVYIQEKH